MAVGWPIWRAIDVSRYLARETEVGKGQYFVRWGGRSPLGEVSGHSVALGNSDSLRRRILDDAVPPRCQITGKGPEVWWVAVLT